MKYQYGDIAVHWASKICPNMVIAIIYYHVDQQRKKDIVSSEVAIS